jgi:uncharacterized protein (TIGR02678 family)
MKTEIAPRQPPAAVPLDERLSEVAREERQRAIRALLQNPLLTADGPHGAEFGLIRRHTDELRDWLAHQTNWTLQVTSELARLRKTPPETTDCTRAARDLRTDAPFTRSRYVLLCLALAALERSERQTTLGRLAEAMLGFFAGDASLAACGLSFDLKSMDQRRDLVQVIRFLCDRRVLWRRQGDEDLFIKDAHSDVLYNVNRPVLTGMLCVRRGPSTVTATGLAERLAAIVEEPMPDTEEGQNRQIRIHLMRRLLDDPVLYYSSLEPRERAYLDRQRGIMLRQITDFTGLVPEVRAEGIAMLDPCGDLSDLALPEEGTEGHLILLMIELLTNRLRERERESVGFSELCMHTASWIAEHKQHWRKDVTAPDAERLLAEAAIGRLEALGLVRRIPDGVQPLPALGRYTLAEDAEQDSIEEGPSLL